MRIHFHLYHFKALHLLAMLFFTIASFSQKSTLDSLINISGKMNENSIKALNFISISNKFRTEKIDYDNAKKYAKQAASLSKKINFPEGVYKAMLAQGYVNRDMAMNPEAITELKNAVAYFESHAALTNNINLRTSHIYNYTALAEIYSKLPDYDSAQKYAFAALSLSEKHNTGIGQCWITLSIIFSKQKDLDQANKYALKAADYFKTNNAFDDLARSYAYLAGYAFTAENYTKTIEYYQLAYDFYKKANSLYGMRIAYYNLSETYLKIKDYAKADYYCIETMKIKGAENDLVYLFYINQLRYNINFEKKNYTEALAISKTILELAQKEKNLENISAAYENQYAVYKALKNNEKALEMIEKINSIKDSIYNADIAKNTAAIAKKYEAEKQANLIRFLEKENSFTKQKIQQELELSNALKNENIFKEAKIEQEQEFSKVLFESNELRKNQLKKEVELNKTLQSKNKLALEKSNDEGIIRWLLVLVVIIIFTLAFNNYLHLKRQKKANLKINKQAEGLKDLVKETHHRVKNNLQLTISMLRMQARSIDKKTASEALKNSENRLQTIAMVHEKLYNSELVEGVILEEYLKELMQYLAVQFNGNTAPFNYKIIDDTHLNTNLDTAVMLGLIVNELVTNSIKYAFQDIKNPTITITIAYHETKTTNNCQLIIQDNGIGLPNNLNIENQETLGLKLVKLFTEQLNGKLDFKNEDGAVFIVSFPL